MYHQTFANQLTPRVEQALQGIEWTQACQPLPRVHLPITIQLVHRIITALLQEPSNYENILLWAACCIEIVSFLRCSEFTVPSVQEYDPSAYLSYVQWCVIRLKGLTISCLNSPKAIKDWSFSERHLLVLWENWCRYFPVKPSYHTYVIIRCSKPGPLFLTVDNKPITCQRFRASLSNPLKKIGLPASVTASIVLELVAPPWKRMLEFHTHIPILERCWSFAYQQYFFVWPINYFT